MLLTRAMPRWPYIRPLADRTLLVAETPCHFCRSAAVSCPCWWRPASRSGPRRSRRRPRPQWLTERLDSWYQRAQRSAPGEWGIAVADQSGQMLWSVNPDLPLMPASTVKLFTTGFARSVLGGTARRPTRVVGVGSVDPATGEWIGSWALEMNGDPSLERAEGSGPTLYDLAHAARGRGRAEADRSAPAPELERSRQRGLSRRLVVAAPGPDLRPAGRPAHPAREHRLDHRSAGRPRRASGCGSSRRRRTASARW